MEALGLFFLEKLKVFVTPSLSVRTPGPYRCHLLICYNENLLGALLLPYANLLFSRILPEFIHIGEWQRAGWME